MSDQLWRKYQTGRASLDHTDREVFNEVVAETVARAEAAEKERDDLQRELEANHVPAATMTECETHGTWYKPSEGCALCLHQRVAELEEENKVIRGHLEASDLDHTSHRSAARCIAPYQKHKHLHKRPA